MPKPPEFIFIANGHQVRARSVRGISVETVSAYTCERSISAGRAEIEFRENDVERLLCIAVNVRD